LVDLAGSEKISKS